MGRKSYRPRIPRPEPEKQPMAPVRRYTLRATRSGSAKADFTDESQYVHVRRDLLRIGLLALCLFGSLVVLRVVTAALGLLP
jgi:hypothetical protein